MRDEWRGRRACKDVDPSVFYPYNLDTDEPLETEETSAEAKAVCFVCPVREECLEEALYEKEQRGIWGGMTTPERNNVIRQRKR